jgi:hypothetical protein
VYSNPSLREAEVGIYLPWTAQAKEFQPLAAAQVPVPRPAPTRTPRSLPESSAAIFYSSPLSEERGGAYHAEIRGWAIWQKQRRFLWLTGSGLLYHGADEAGAPEDHIDIHDYSLCARSYIEIRLTLPNLLRRWTKNAVLTLLFYDTQAGRCWYNELWKCQQRQMIKLVKVVNNTYTGNVVDLSEARQRHQHDNAWHLLEGSVV